MSAGARVLGFLAALALIFAAAALAGNAIDPSVEGGSDGHEAMDASAPEATTAHDAMATSSEEGSVLPGLASTQDGYRLIAERTRLRAGGDESYSFRIGGPAGEIVESFDLEHERLMHLIVVRRDFEAFQHVHPRQLADGSWRAGIDVREPGVYRVFADFVTEGRALTLATDLFVPGRFKPEPLPAASRSADAGDGYTVALRSPPARSGATAPVRFTIRRDGRRLASVQPYLGADGHLVALRAGDQAFLHVHPEGEAGGSGPISFGVEYPTPGRYRLFLQFRHADRVRTAAFTQEVTAGSEPVGGSSHGEH